MTRKTDLEQHIHASYALNNPLRYADPSGHTACIDIRCDLLSHPVTQRPILAGIAPAAITYIYGEMMRNAQSSLVRIMAAANALSRVGPSTGCDSCAKGSKALALSTWTSQVMDARVKKYVGPFAPLLGNWDHKPKIKPQDPSQPSPVPEVVRHQGWSTIGSSLYYYDIWSNIHYGYVGRAAGFSQSELTGGAGGEQPVSDTLSGRAPHRSAGSDNWLASWDESSDNAAIQIGIRLWNQYGLTVRPADLYLAVLQEPRLNTRSLGDVP